MASYELKVELSQIYSSKILEIAKQMSNMAPLNNPDAVATKTSKVCGAKISISLKMDKGKISQYSQQISADALGQFCASIVQKNIIGSTDNELRRLYDKMQKMLKENGTPPNGKWADLRYLEPIREFKARHSSIMLIFEAIISCLDEIADKNNE